MLTAVPTGVPSRLYVVSKIAHCPKKGSRVCVAALIVRLRPYLSLSAGARSLPSGSSRKPDPGTPARLRGMHALSSPALEPRRSCAWFPSPVSSHGRRRPRRSPWVRRCRRRVLRTQGEREIYQAFRDLTCVYGLAEE